MRSKEEGFKREPDAAISNELQSDFKNVVADLSDKVREQVPLIHQITNYVTVGDCANATLAIGASPIMADEILETAEITAISSALVLNIGTLNERTVASMMESGKKANALGIPVIFDPVGAGASAFRNETTKAILEQIKITILRGNRSELSFIAGQKSSTRGVDTSEADNGNDGIAIARSVSKRYHCVTAITGAADIISDGERTVMIENGHSLLAKVTGTGCMSNALVAAFAAVAEDPMAAAVGGVATMGIAGEIAYHNCSILEKCDKTLIKGNPCDKQRIGIGSFRIGLMDAIGRMDKELILEKIKIHEELGLNNESAQGIEGGL